MTNGSRPAAIELAARSNRTRMATIWITGGKGFIGQHLASHIAGDGQQVHGIGHDQRTRNDALIWPYASWSSGEIDSATLDQLAARSGLPDTIYHLAGGSSVGASFQHPHDDFARTVETTARLLEWLRLRAVGVKVVAVSSAAVYGASHRDAISEVSPLSPYSPYGAHKAMMEILASSTVVLHPSNRDGLITAVQARISATTS